MAVRIGDLATRFDCELDGDPGIGVERVATLANAGAGCLSFLANPAYRGLLKTTAASAVVLHPDAAAECPAAVLISEDPYLTYARIAALLHPPAAYAPGVHPSASVDDGAELGTGVHVAAQAVIAAGCRLGDGVYIGPGCVVMERATLGDGVRLLANVTVMHEVEIGARSIVHPGAVLGSDGFGNARGPDGWVKVPQVGTVRIGDDVEIGANTTVDRGAIDDTVIESGVRLDNLIQIAHNVRIGEHTAVASMSGISGSTTIGKRCLLAGQCGIVGHVTVCDDVIIGGATMVTKDIDEPGFYTASFPAEKARDWKRRVARFRRLDELAERVRRLDEGGSDDA